MIGLGWSNGPRLPSSRPGGEDHDGGTEADDADHRDREQGAQLPVVGAEHDRGVLGGECLAHDCLLSGDRRLDGSPRWCWWRTASVAIMRGSSRGSVTTR